jgi:hypothetical protein
MAFDWHADTITSSTLLDSRYRTTQNVRRFLISQCGSKFAFSREFMAWVRTGAPQTMGDIANEWKRLHPKG